MKTRILSLLLALIFCLSAFSACSGENKPSDDTLGNTDTTVNTDTTEPAEAVIYVDSSAEDNGDGSKTAPFKTIADAQAKIREMKAAGLPDGGVTVLLANGKYAPIALTAEDSGSESSPIVYKAAEDKGAAITGGITLSASDFTALDDDEKSRLLEDGAKDKVLKVDLTKYGITSENIGVLYSHGNSSKGYKDGIGSAELFIDSERMPLSRYPNDTYLKPGKTDGETVFTLRDDVKERALSWDLDDIWAFGYFYQEWSDATIQITNIDFEQNQITLADEQHYGIGSGGRYFFLNVFEETDMPGEYYIDRENSILYVYPTENFDSASIVLSTSEQTLITADNISYVSFEGLNITGTRANGIVISAGDHITISDCNISDIRQKAIYANGSDIVIKNNEIHQIGDAAIELYGGDILTLTAANHLVYNNHIHHFAQLGRTYECAIFFRGCGMTASHNEIHDAPHEAIEYYGPNHIVEYNEIYRVCTETGDCGAIYALRSFREYGCVVRYNFIHDIGQRGYRADGIFLDDGESGQTLIGNLIVNVSGHGINLGGGRDNTVENNLIIGWGYKSSKALLYDNRGRDYMLYDDPEQAQKMADEMKRYQAQQEWLDAFPGYGDIIPFYVGYEGDVEDPMLSGNPACNVFRNNMFYKMEQTFLAGDNNPNVSYRLIMNMESYNNFVENCLSLQDYDHVDIPGYADGDYTLAENSQAYQNGFEKLPTDQMGRIIEE